MVVAMQPIYNQRGEVIGWVKPEELHGYGPLPGMRKGMILEVTWADEKTTMFRVISQGAQRDPEP